MRPIYHVLEEKNVKDDKAFDNIADLPPAPLNQRRSYLCSWLLHLCAHLSLILVQVAVATAIIYSNRSSRSHGPNLIYSPAREAIEFKVQHYILRPEDSPYAGLPDPSLDAAWDDLLQYSNIRISSAEMAAIDPERKEETIALPDGGYFSTLTVYHELHCLQHLHQYMYPAYYFPNLSDQEKEYNRYHNEHCIDVLRQSVMCHGDITPLTMRWGKMQKIPLANFSSPHECVNWASINDWARERSVEHIADPGYLKHPKYGVVIDEDFDNRIGLVNDER